MSKTLVPGGTLPCFTADFNPKFRTSRNSEFGCSPKIFAAST